MMRQCIQSLLHTARGSELIVCDNGGSADDSRFLLEHCLSGGIASYTRYRNNMHLGYARNDALRRASRPYIAVVDNDILFEEGWLEECVRWLESTQGKYFATPLSPDPMNGMRSVRWDGEANGWRLNTRAGSNAWVMPRSALDEIGFFQTNSTITGSRYADKVYHAGYRIGVMPVSKATDLGFRKGNDFKHATIPSNL